MSVKALLKQLSKEGFSIVSWGSGYKVLGEHAVGTFSVLNGRPINLCTFDRRVASEYNEGYQPGINHYSSRRFLQALKKA